MNQKQKDTIREEYRERFKVSGFFPIEIQLENWWLNKIEEAYQSGAKDKVEEVEILLNKTKLPTNGEGNIRTLLYIPDEDYNRAVNKRIDWTIKSLKDNT
jgi:hypothetical protein